MLDATHIFDASLLVSLFIAMAGGLISFLSPCVLPIVPPYLAYMSGISMTEMSGDETGQAKGRGKVLLAAVFFVMGLSVVFLMMGLAASFAGRFLIQNQTLFMTIAGIVIMIMGAHFVGVFRIKFMDREARIDAGDQGGSAFGAFILGLAFAFGWSPCLGPILGAISTMAMMEGDATRSVLLFVFYAMGLGIPFLLVAAFFPRLKGLMNWMKRHMGRIEATMGLLLWTVGLMMATGQFTEFALWINEKFPVLQAFG